MLLLVSTCARADEELSTAQESPKQMAEKLGIKLPALPWHVADIWWKFDKPIEHFETLTMDVTIDRDVPTNYNLYISPVGIAKINGMDFYGGLQTGINGWASRTNQERVFVGKGAIFSRWSHDKKKPIGLDFVRLASDGLCESAGYEGEFCSVRRPFAWSKGTYTYSVIKGDTEMVKGEPQTWFHCLVAPIPRARPVGSAACGLKEQISNSGISTRPLWKFTPLKSCLARTFQRSMSPSVIPA